MIYCISLLGGRSFAGNDGPDKAQTEMSAPCSVFFSRIGFIERLKFNHKDILLLMEEKNADWFVRTFYL